MILLALTGLGLVAMVSLAALRAWLGWLDIRRLEIAAGSGAAPGFDRGDLASLRERVKRLEAIAAGVEA
ncbi:hypothetical protein [Allosphingosinicella sp.]|uniref:hypothetical protein n=1 Tax=Allosphingosinicella sp. TaxID=2823234 RepID=UPI0037847259